MNRNWKNQDITCQHYPTRPQLIEGQLLTDQQNNSIFIHFEYKIIFKLTGKQEICKCKHVYKTNYQGLFLNPVPPCAEIDEKQLPPSALNMEFSENVKIDYALFHSENITQFVYETLYSGQIKVAESNLRNFLTLAQKQNELGIFEIKRPLYAKLRGEVLSLMNCPEESLAVIKDTERCTKQVQVMKNGTFLYVAVGSRLLQKQFEVTECREHELADIVYVHDKNGTEFFITQEETITIFENITGHINESETILSPQMVFKSLTQVSSFYESGLYDPKFLQKRQTYLFSGEVYGSIRTGITSAIFPRSTMDWEEAAFGNIDIAGLIGVENLREMFWGNGFVRFIKTTLEILGYLSAVHMLRLILIYIIKMKMKRITRAALICISCRSDKICQDNGSDYDSSSSDSDKDTDEQDVEMSLNLKRRYLVTHLLLLTLLKIESHFQI